MQLQWHVVSCAEDEISCDAVVPGRIEHGHISRSNTVARELSCRIRSAVSDWRMLFNHSSLPFFNVELAACNNYPNAAINAHAWAYMRQASRSFLSLPSTTGFVTAIDVGTVGGAVHSPEKQPVGHRLALQLLKRVYGQDVLADGPSPQSIMLGGSKLLQIDFRNAEELHVMATASHNTTGSKVGCAESPFELGYADSTWIRVNFTIATSKVLLSLPDHNEQPTEVRYAWEGFPQCVLYSGLSGDFSSLSSLPAAPFRLAVSSTCGAGQVRCLLEADPSVGQVEAQCCGGGEVCVARGGCQNPSWTPINRSDLQQKQSDLIALLPNAPTYV